MLRLALILLTMIAANGACATHVPRVNCNAQHQRELDLTPRGSGPLQLSAVYCQFPRSTSFLFSAPLVSPDAQSIAHYGEEKAVLVARLDGGKTWTETPAALGVFARFGSNFRSVVAFAWSSDSKFVWAGTNEMMKPSGFALSPLQPVQAGGDGRLISLPPLRHDAGPLDGLLWIGGEGLALAQFGTRGSLYKPEHDDPAPALALVDAQRGLVLDARPFTAFEPLRDRSTGSPPYAFVRNAAATTLPDGKVHALLDVGAWVVWTQGEPSRVLPNPYAAEFHNRMAMSPDGSRVLVGRMLRTDGGMCGRTGGCRPGTPVEGVLAALHDLETGQPLWSIRATATQDHEFPTPAISPDGRYALVGLMPAGERPLIALIAMQDGKIVQTFPAPGGPYAMGFARGGLTVWTHAYGLTALYDVTP